MKRVFKMAMIVIAAVVVMCMPAVAQQAGDKAVGANLVIGTGDSYNNVGIGAKFFYNVTDPIRVAGEFDFFLKKDYLSMWDLSVYGHYLFPVSDQVMIYPSIGLGMIGFKFTDPFFGGNYSESKFVFSLGGGADYALTDVLSLTGELRIKFYEGNNRINFALGIAYKF